MISARKIGSKACKRLVIGVMYGAEWKGQRRSLRKGKEPTVCKCFVKMMEALSNQYA